MLVFRRQQGESFMIGDSVEVRVLKVGRGHVKIGVVAPREIEIFRSEIARLNRRAVLKERPSAEQTRSLRKLIERLSLPKP